jgi:hypothetical protein
MSTLLNLPQDVLQSVFGTWLKTNALTLLDSACCAHNTRNDFLSVIQSSHFPPINNPSLNWNNGQLLDWSLARHQRIKRIDNLAPSATFLFLRRLLKTEQKKNSNIHISLEHLERLSFQHDVQLNNQEPNNLAQSVIDIINRCPHLKHLHLINNNHTGDFFLKPTTIWNYINPAIWSQLLVLRLSIHNSNYSSNPIEMSPTPTFSLLKFISNTLTNLVVLQILLWEYTGTTYLESFPTAATFVELLLKAIANNKSLVTLHCNNVVKITEFIGQLDKRNNPKLVNLRFLTHVHPSSTFNIVDLIDCIQQPDCPVQECTIMNRLYDVTFIPSEEFLYYKRLQHGHFLRSTFRSWMHDVSCRSQWPNMNITHLAINNKRKYHENNIGAVPMLCNILNLERVSFFHHSSFAMTKELMILLQYAKPNLREIITVTDDTTAGIVTEGDATALCYSDCIKKCKMTKIKVILIHKNHLNNFLQIIYTNYSDSELSQRTSNIQDLLLVPM